VKRIAVVAACLTIIISSSFCLRNQPPSTPLITATDTVVESNVQILLEATAEDPDGDFLYWLWEGQGSFNSTTDAAVAWIAPEVPDTQVLILTVTADDNKGGQSSASINITVTPREISGDTFDVVVGTAEGFRDPPFYFDIDEDYYRYQVLYKDSEIDTSGRISRISIMSPADAVQGSFHSFRIYMSAVDRDELTSPFEENYEGEQPRLVYQTQSISYPETKDEWFDINLANSFDYDSGENLLIEIRWKGSTGATIPTYGFGTTGNRSNSSQYEDASEGNPDSWALYIKLRFER